MERGWKPNFEICPPCPRCGSSNTKFCYYNNYSLTQPRYFCKGCRRYWTKGGSLRNIPVGGGCRKTRRAKVVRVADTANARNILAHGGGNVENRGGDGGVGLIGLPTNIDLQQVYANFLKQGSKVTHQERMHDQVLPSEVDPMTSFGSGRIPNIDMEFGGVNYGSNLESFQTEGGGIQFFGYNSIFNNDYGEKHYFVTNSIFDCGLLPLPGEELGWSESHIGLLESVFDPSIKPKHHVSPYCSAKLFEQMPNIDTM